MADSFDFKVEVRIVPQALRDYILDPANPPMRAVEETADAILRAAIPKIGTRYSGTTGKPRQPRPNKLKDSGKVVPQGPGSFAVIFEHEAAEVHHDGASGHTYSGNKWFSNPNSPATRSGGRFRRYGRPAFTHPGNAANPYLLDAANEVAQRAGSLKRGASPAQPTFRPRSPGFFS